MTHTIRTVDVTDWQDWERPDMAMPFEVAFSPYGETMRRYFDTEAGAVAFANEISALSGTYSTSWGEDVVNTDSTVIRYVIAEAQAYPQSA